MVSRNKKKEAESYSKLEEKLKEEKVAQAIKEELEKEEPKSEGTPKKTLADEGSEDTEESEAKEEPLEVRVEGAPDAEPRETSNYGDSPIYDVSYTGAIGGYGQGPSPKTQIQEFLNANRLFNIDLRTNRELRNQMVQKLTGELPHLNKKQIQSYFNEIIYADIAKEKGKKDNEYQNEIP